MNRLRLMYTAVVLSAVGVFTGCAEQNRSRVRIDPQADQTLRKMSATLAKARSFSFRSMTTMDEPIETGQLAHFTRHIQVAVCRPNRVFAECQQDDDVFTLCYLGTELTVMDKAAKAYASVKVPGRIDQMLDEVDQKYGLTMPLSDLVYSDPYKVLTEDAWTGRYVGIHEVNGVKCHHLLFTQEGIDWQIWIDTGKESLPRKFAIDYKAMPLRPQFTALLSDWNLSAKTGDEQFRPALPAGAKKVELTPLFQAAKRGE
jgi:hypothetical protein